MSRELNEKCNECGFEPTIEEKREYQGTSLAVSVCLICHSFDWTLPPDWDEDDNETLDLTQEWAEQESIKILKERSIYYDIHFSEASKLILLEENIEEIRHTMLELCKILNTNKVTIGKHRHGLRIEFPLPYQNVPTNAFQGSKLKETAE